MPRPTIHCPLCHRELFNLRHRHCLWCGADIPREQFELVAAPPAPEDTAFQQPTPLYLPPTYGTGLSGSGAFRRFNPLRSINGAVSSWERKLRIAGAAVALCFVAAKLGETLWSLWRIHQMTPLLSHLR